MPHVRRSSEGRRPLRAGDRRTRARGATGDDCPAPSTASRHPGSRACSKGRCAASDSGSAADKRPPCPTARPASRPRPEPVGARRCSGWPRTPQAARAAARTTTPRSPEPPDTPAPRRLSFSGAQQGRRPRARGRRDPRGSAHGQPLRDMLPSCGAPWSALCKTQRGTRGKTEIEARHRWSRYATHEFAAVQARAVRLSAGCQ